MNNAGNRITEYAPNSNGDARPVRVISGSKTLLSNPWGIALDSSSNIYVTNGDSINVYAANAKGNASPERLISGSLTKLGEPEGIAVDASGYAYVANWDASTLWFLRRVPTATNRRREKIHPGFMAPTASP